MMSKILILLGIVVLTLIITVNNPVNISINLIGLSSILFLEMYLISSNSWFPTIYFLVFMGGILIIFIILSSILPNENENKGVNGNVTFLIIPPIVTLWVAVPQPGTYYANAFINSNLNFFMLVALIILYFFFSISIVSSENSPIRSAICLNNNLIL